MKHSNFLSAVSRPIPVAAVLAAIAIRVLRSTVSVSVQAGRSTAVFMEPNKQQEINGKRVFMQGTRQL